MLCPAQMCTFLRSPASCVEDDTVVTLQNGDAGRKSRNPLAHVPPLSPGGRELSRSAAGSWPSQHPLVSSGQPCVLSARRRKMCLEVGIVLLGSCPCPLASSCLQTGLLQALSVGGSERVSPGPLATTKGKQRNREGTQSQAWGGKRVLQRWPQTQWSFSPAPA